jgi:hypothetical protein
MQRRDVRKVDVPTHDDVGTRLCPRGDSLFITVQTVVNLAPPQHMHRLMSDHHSQLLISSVSQAPRDAVDLLR